jgi:hypothetical protein
MAVTAHACFGLFSYLRSGDPSGWFFVAGVVQIVYLLPLWVLLRFASFHSAARAVAGCAAFALAFDAWMCGGILQGLGNIK